MFKRILTFFAFMLLLVTDIYAQCPMRKASVESSQSSGTKSVGMGLNIGILMLLVSVYILVFSVGIVWYRKFRHKQVQENAT